MECVYCGTPESKLEYKWIRCRCKTVVYCSPICKKFYSCIHGNLCDKFRESIAPNSLFIYQNGTVSMENACKDDIDTMMNNDILGWGHTTTFTHEGIRYAVESGSPFFWKRNMNIHKLYGDILITRDTGCFERFVSSECPEGPLSKILHTPKELISILKKK